MRSYIVKKEPYWFARSFGTHRQTHKHPITFSIMIVYIFRENLVIVVKDKLDVKPDKTIAFLLKTRTYIEYSGDQNTMDVNCYIHPQ